MQLITIDKNIEKQENENENVLKLSEKKRKGKSYIVMKFKF